MSTFSLVTWRLWLVLSFAVIVITAATALQRRDLTVRVPATGEISRPNACVPETVSKPVPNSGLLDPLASKPRYAEVRCTSWQELGRRALIAFAVCLFAGLVMLGFFWVASAGRRQESR